MKAMTLEGLMTMSSFSGVPKMTFKMDTKKLTLGMAGLTTRLEAAIMVLANTHAASLEAQMKRERPWTDRTNMARVSLRGVVSRPSVAVVRITLSHGVTYGKFLELAHGKRYAIVRPTIEKEAYKVFNSFDKLLHKI